MKKYIHYKIKDVYKRKRVIGNVYYSNFISEINNIIKPKYKWDTPNITCTILYFKFNKKWFKFEDVQPKRWFLERYYDKIKEYNNIEEILIDYPQFMLF